jgi:formylglycine-generating enzyme required for sulfatase activity
LQKGKATLVDLTTVGATQLGCTAAPWNLTDYPLSFPDNGNWTGPVYAASVPGVLPSTCITWFQAEQACALAGKRLVTNQEWQRAAAGTPDPGDPDDDTTECEVGQDLVNDPVNTGSRSDCVSSWGAFDMVGNVWEWVADWGERAPACGNWNAAFGDDLTCVGGDGSLNFPGAPLRGGDWNIGTDAGVFAVRGGDPKDGDGDHGFRCAR